jgi:hypothetical protein
MAECTDWVRSLLVVRVFNFGGEFMPKVLSVDNIAALHLNVMSHLGEDASVVFVFSLGKKFAVRC